MIKTSDIAWIAGFLEGEGHFRGGHNDRRVAVAVTASQKQRWPLDQLVVVLGIGSIKREGDRIWRWSVHGIRAASLMMTLYPWLSPKRRKEVAPALRWWRTRPLHPRDRIRCPFGHAYVRHYRGSGRECKECENARARRRYWRKKAAA